MNIINFFSNIFLINHKFLNLLLNTTKNKRKKQKKYKKTIKQTKPTITVIKDLFINILNVE